MIKKLSFIFGSKTKAQEIVLLKNDAKKVVRTFYMGESAKLILTAVMFFLVFQWSEVVIIPLMAGFVAALTVFWFALIIRL